MVLWDSPLLFLSAVFIDTSLYVSTMMSIRSYPDGIDLMNFQVGSSYVSGISFSVPKLGIMSIKNAETVLLSGEYPLG